LATLRGRSKLGVVAARIEQNRRTHDHQQIVALRFSET
jgi:hypothetical protein